MNKQEIMSAIVNFMERKLDEYAEEFEQEQGHIAAADMVRFTSAYIEGLQKTSEWIDKHYIRVEGK